MSSQKCNFCKNKVSLDSCSQCGKRVCISCILMCDNCNIDLCSNCINTNHKIVYGLCKQCSKIYNDTIICAKKAYLFSD